MGLESSLEYLPRRTPRSIGVSCSTNPAGRKAIDTFGRRPIAAAGDSSENRRQADLLIRHDDRYCGRSRCCRHRRISTLHFPSQRLSLRIRRHVRAWFLFRRCPPTCSPPWRPPGVAAHESSSCALSPCLHTRAGVGPGARTDEIGRTEQTAVSRLRELGPRLRDLLPVAVRQWAMTGSSLSSSVLH